MVKKEKDDEEDKEDEEEKEIPQGRSVGPTRRVIDALPTP